MIIEMMMMIMIMMMMMMMMMTMMMMMIMLMTYSLFESLKLCLLTPFERLEMAQKARIEMMLMILVMLDLGSKTTAAKFLERTITILFHLRLLSSAK